jgi:ubiquinone/menaquinone biosynthesis C-methylase UbiE
MTETIAHSRFADLYDSYVHVTQDIPFFLHAARQVDGPVLELMCGTGRVSLPLVEAGVRLTCVDYSTEMLAVLRRKLAASHHRAEIVCQDVRQLQLDRHFPLAFLPFHSFAELLTRTDQRQALSQVYRHLEPGGRFICTLHNPTVRLAKVDGELRLWGAHPLLDRSGKLLLWGLETYHTEQSIVHGMQFFEEYDTHGKLRSRRLLETQFAILSQVDFENLAVEIGFALASIYGDYSAAAFDPAASPFMIWTLVK